MASDQKNWQIVKIAKSAQKNIQSLEPNTQKKIINQFESLKSDPFKIDIKKVKGKKNIYRGRIGNSRYYFRLCNKTKSIEILLFDNRSCIKQKTIQRMN